MKKKLLIVEDEKHIAIGLVANFELLGYEVHLVEDGSKVLEAYREFKPDIMILDLMLPGLSGFEVLAQIRKTETNLPILVLSAKNSEKSRIRSLVEGSDDFLAKPFSLDELILRVERLLKWTESTTKIAEKPTYFAINSHTVDLGSGEVTGTNASFYLTEQELRLFQVFIENDGKILSREQLLEQAWGYSKGIETRTVDNFIVRLRKYFEIDPKNPKHFINKRARGYLFKI